ncbi:MAG TPA: hypothetical protein VI279_11255 [Rhodocyclaceae bacterium]
MAGYEAWVKRNVTDPFSQTLFARMNSPIRGIWETVEGQFFVATSLIPHPDEIIEGISSDKADRELMEAPHPLKGRMNASGCYLYYCYYDWGEGTKPVYIYAGKTARLGKRLWTHWSDGERIDKFFESHVDSGHLDMQITLADGSIHTIQPEPIIRVALWFVAGKRERTMLEHGIIYAYQPRMNNG